MAETRIYLDTQDDYIPIETNNVPSVDDRVYVKGFYYTVVSVKKTHIVGDWDSYVFWTVRADKDEDQRP